MNRLTSLALGLLTACLAQAVVQSPLDCQIAYDGTNTVQLRWNATPGKSYVLENATNLLGPWSAAPAVVATSNALSQSFPTTAEAQFFRVVKLDTEGPVITERKPSDGSIAVSRQSPMSMVLSDLNGVETNGLSLKVGTNVPATLADACLSLVGDVLTYTPGTNEFLGSAGAFVTNLLIAADLLGNRSTNRWSFQLAYEPVPNPKIFFIGSGGAPSPRGSQPGPGDDLTLVSTNGDYFTFTYSGASSGLSNGVPLVKSDLRTGFTRTVVSFTEYPASNTVVVLTRPAKIAELLQQGSLQSAVFTELTSPSLIGSGPEAGLLETGLTLNYSFSLERVLYQDGYLAIGLSDASELNLSAAFEVGANFSGARLTAFEADFTGTADFTLEAYATISAAYSRSGEKGLISPIRKFYGGFIGPVPVWLELVFEVNAGYELNLGGAATYTSGFNAVKQIKVGRRWDTNKGWTTIWENPELGFTLLGPTWQVEATGSVQVYLQPKVTVLVYSAAGASADLKPYAELAGRVQLNPYQFELGLYAGLSSTIALDLRVWDDAWGELPSLTFDLIPRTQLWGYKSLPLVPEIRVQPRPQAVSAGETVTFTVQALGAPPLSHRWLKNELPLSEDERVGGTRSSTLRIAHAQTNDAGRYRVLVSNPVATTTSQEVLLTVYPTNIPAGVAVSPTGSFTMGDTFGEGDAIERPTHTVNLSGYTLEKYEVTKLLWGLVYQWATNHGYSFDNAGAGKALNHPVHTVNWFDCVKWCNARSEMEGRIPAYYTDAAQTVVYRTGRVNVQNGWVKWNAGYRLPTEAEWERAARGGTPGRRYPWSDSNSISHGRANYGFDPAFQSGGWPYTSPVGTFAANAYGLYDMAGNVNEWCWDWGAPYSSATQTNPRGPASGDGRIIRGGGWAGYESNCRVAYRTIHTTWNQGEYLGFRTVLPVGP